jgi:hypothetical protein
MPSSTLTPTKPIDYTKPVDTQELTVVSRMMDLFYKARDERRPLVHQWNKNYRLLRNNYWTRNRPDWMPRPEIPEIFPLVASFVGWMTDQRPQWRFTPWASMHSPYYDQMDKLGDDLATVMLSRWDDDDFETDVERCIWDSQIYGTGIVKIGWDATVHYGLGDMVMRRVDPYTFYPDPQSTSMRDSNYFIEARTYTLQELDRRWPGAALAFPAGMEEGDLDSAPSQLKPREEMPMANLGPISPATVPRYSLYGQSRLDNRNVIDEGVTVFECWIREHYFDESKLIDGWRVIIIAGNRVLMNESAEDLWEHGQHPYERFLPYDLGEFWGLSLVELLCSPQESLNRLLASLQHNIELVGNPIFKEGTRSGLQRTAITNRPGQRITVNDNSQAEWLEPPHLHEMIPELIQYFLKRMEVISGLSAVTRGGEAKGRTAEGVVDSMQEAAFVRVRMALRNLERFLKRSGQKAASLVVENYNEPRIVAHLGDDGQATAKTLLANHFYVPGLDGVQMPLKFRLRVDVGSQSETSKQSREAKAQQLYAMGAIDRMALLEAVDWPNRKAIMQRITSLEAMGAFNPPGARQRAGRGT